MVERDLFPDHNERYLLLRAGSAFRRQGGGRSWPGIYKIFWKVPGRFLHGFPCHDLYRVESLADLPRDWPDCPENGVLAKFVHEFCSHHKADAFAVAPVLQPALKLRHRIVSQLEVVACVGIVGERENATTKERQNMDEDVRVRVNEDCSVFSLKNLPSAG